MDSSDSSSEPGLPATHASAGASFSQSDRLSNEFSKVQKALKRQKYRDRNPNAVKTQQAKKRDNKNNQSNKSNQPK